MLRVFSCTETLRRGTYTTCTRFPPPVYAFVCIKYVGEELRRKYTRLLSIIVAESKWLGRVYIFVVTNLSFLPSPTKILAGIALDMLIIILRDTYVCTFGRIDYGKKEGTKHNYSAWHNF